jgi:hypothetical protein
MTSLGGAANGVAVAWNPGFPAAIGGRNTDERGTIDA